MSLLKQVLDIVALRQEKGASPGTRNEQDESPAQTIASKHAWVVDISLAALEAGENLPDELRAAMIYELGKSGGEQWELIDQQRYEVRGDAEGFCRGFLSTMIRLGMRQGDLIIVLANEQYWIDCAVREMSVATIGETRAHKPCSTAGVILPPPSGSDPRISGEEGDVERVLAAIRRVKIVEYLKNHLA